MQKRLRDKSLPRFVLLFFNNLGPLHTSSNHNSTLFLSLPRKNFSDLGIKYSVDSNFLRRLSMSNSLTKNLSIDRVPSNGIIHSQILILSWDKIKGCPNFRYFKKLSILVGRCNSIEISNLLKEIDSRSV